FPFLFLTTISEKTYPQFYVVARTWRIMILVGMGFFPKVKRTQQLDKHKSYMLIAKHNSMIDIMMMFWVVRTPFVFIGKRSWPRCRCLVFSTAGLRFWWIAPTGGAKWRFFKKHNDGLIREAGFVFFRKAGFLKTIFKR